MLQDVHQRRTEIRERLSQLSEERRLLFSELFALESAQGQQLLPPVVEASPVTPQEKVSLFRRRFVCRSDVFPVFWENHRKGTKGYYPACDSVYENGARLKPSEVYARYGASRFQRLDDDVLADHLTGKRTIGTYAIRPNDRCLFLAADFDEGGWREAVTAYLDAALTMGFQLLVEVSRSGDGAHAWLFFAEPIAARLARGLGTCLLAEAAARVSRLDLAVHDRFFPNQDTLPKGGFGNLIGLPLQKKLREAGRTVFVDEGFDALADQWRALAETPAYWDHHVRRAVESYVETSPFEEASSIEFEEACLVRSAK